MAKIDFERLVNVRDLGGMAGRDGKRIREGVLFRGDQLFPATEADKRALVDLGVHTVVDLRSEAEHEEKPDPCIDGVRNVYLPIIKDVRAGITHGEQETMRIGQMLAGGMVPDPSFVDSYMQNMYRQFVEDPFANQQYGRFVDEVIASAQAGEGVLWHCTAGKDRAGFAAAILLEVLGASREDIVADYLLTNDYLAGFVEGLLARLADRLPSDEAKDIARRFFMADASFLAAAFDAADQRYGSFEGYLDQALGIDAAKRATLQELLLA